MDIIAEYKKLTKEIAVLTSQIRSLERELNKVTAAYAPAGCKAIDYSKPSVQSSRVVPNVESVASRIYELTRELSEMRGERDEIIKQRDDLDKCIDDLGELKSKIAMLKISGKTTRRIAYELNYSRRHVERIIKEIGEELVNF